ncbi:Kinase-like protein [Mycena kentingensis (nom. inval.)]|nr:Kinase-like protein [Mycena kentingensis (nom. inval.)]
MKREKYIYGNLRGQQNKDEKLRFLSRIAAGAHSEVWKVEDLDPERRAGRMHPLLAVKILSTLEHDSFVGTQAAEAEICTHLIANGHPNILRAYKPFSHGHFRALLLDFAAGTLMDALRLGRFTANEVLIRAVVLSLARAIQYLQSKEIYHRDLKLENILCDPHDVSHIWIADFGVALIGDTPTRTFAGTVPYMAPEALYKEHHSPQLCDPWSLGILTLNLLTEGHFPWRRASEDDWHFDSYKSDRQFLRAMFPYLSTSVLHFLSRFFHPDAHKRPNLDEFIFRFENISSLFFGPNDLHRVCVIKGLRIPPPAAMLSSATVHTREEAGMMMALLDRDDCEWWQRKPGERVSRAAVWGEGGRDLDKRGVPVRPQPELDFQRRRELQLRASRRHHDRTSADDLEGLAGHISRMYNGFVTLVRGGDAAGTSHFQKSATMTRGNTTTAPRVSGFLPVADVDQKPLFVPGAITPAEIVRLRDPARLPIPGFGQRQYPSPAAPSPAARMHHISKKDAPHYAPSHPVGSSNVSDPLPFIPIAFNRHATRLRRTRSLGCLPNIRAWGEQGNDSETEALAAAIQQHIDPNSSSSSFSMRAVYLHKLSQRRKAQPLPVPRFAALDHNGFLRGYLTMPASELPNAFSHTTPINFTNLEFGDPAHQIHLKTVRHARPMQYGAFEPRRNPVLNGMRLVIKGRHPWPNNHALRRSIAQISGDGAGREIPRREKYIP